MSVEMLSTEPAQSTTELSLFVRNMSVLWEIDPKLAWKLDQIEDQSLPPVEKTKTGDYTLRRSMGDDRKIYLHSRYDPLAEAQKWAQQYYDEDKFFYIVEGFGLGYHVKALFEKLLGEVIFAVLEPDLHTLRQALTYVDLTQELQSRRLLFLTEPEKTSVHTKLTSLASFIMMGTKIAAHQPSTQVAKDFFVAMQKILTDFIAFTKTGLITLVINSQVTCRNVACNLATYLSTPPINNLKQLFKGYPAIIVSAGPSLQKNLPLLSQVNNQAVIIATQTAFDRWCVCRKCPAPV